MNLPFGPPLRPMLCKRIEALPEDGDWSFEPKWDGFRAVVFRDGDEVEIQSRELKSLGRFFPEVVETVREQLPERCVVDGEIVIATDGGLDFEALQLRLHPAASRIDKLSRESPASFVAFDLLAVGDDDLRAQGYRERRAALEGALADARAPVHLTPVTTDRAVAQEWFSRFEGAGLDGVIAKPSAGAYEPNVRSMLKLKHVRTADCVVAGFRWHKNGPGTLVGSLILGLYDDEDRLHQVGIAASFTMKRRRELCDELAPLREGAAVGHPWTSYAEPTRKPGYGSRWSAGKDLSWEPLRIERVAEVKYDHLQGTRFRHATTFLRWRPDKAPEDCRYDQLETSKPFELEKVFGAGARRR
jgi:ATP-dependent DNA ligase